MGRWCLFFVAMFTICTYLASIGEGGGGIASSRLNGAVTSTAVVITVDKTTDFLAADALHPAYVQIENEIVSYTGKTATQLTGVTRGVADPQTRRATTAVAHADRLKVKTLAVQAIDNFMGYNITTSNASFGAYDALTFGAHLFTNLPKFLAWDYSFLQGQLIMLKFFVLYPLSCAFVFAIGFGLISLAMGLFKL